MVEAGMIMSPLMNRLNFPVFSGLTHDHSVDDVYWQTRNGIEYSKKRHWCFLAEIINDDMAQMPFWRNKVVVKDLEGYCKINISFYPEEGYFDFNGLLKGHTICVLYAQRHDFMDGTVGLRIEDLNTVKVIPASLSTLIKMSDKHPSGKEMATVCWACRQSEKKDDVELETKPSVSGQIPGKSTKLKKCASCKVAKYCSKQCQRDDWKVHKLYCPLMPEFKSLVSIDYDECARDWYQWRSSGGPSVMPQFSQV